MRIAHTCNGVAGINRAPEVVTIRVAGPACGAAVGTCKDHSGTAAQRILPRIPALRLSEVRVAPSARASTGRPAKDHLFDLYDIVCIPRSGVSWCDLPERYGSRKTVYFRFRR